MCRRSTTREIAAPVGRFQAAAFAPCSMPSRRDPCGWRSARRRALVDGVQRPRRAAVLVELQHMQDVGVAKSAGASQDLARLHAAAALDQLNS